MKKIDAEQVAKQKKEKRQANNSLFSMLSKGLEKVRSAVAYNDVEDLEDLRDDDFYVEENADDWD